MAPKAKVFDFYIDLELQLGNIERCRQLYGKYLEWAPHSCVAWGKFAELERSLGETDRGRAIFELAIGQPLLNMPEQAREAPGGKHRRETPLAAPLNLATQSFSALCSFA